MKKRTLVQYRRIIGFLAALCFAAMLFSVPGFAEEAWEADTAGDVYLTIGSYGDDVVAVQSMLAQLGYYFGPLDGDYGSATYNAVLGFQETYGLYTDGEAGPYTIGMLYACTGGPSYGIGEEEPAGAEPDASEDEAAAVEAESAAAEDEAAAGAEQGTAQELELTDSGSIDPDLWLSLGDYSDEVEQVQSILYRLRYLNVEFDGYFGYATQSAVIQFQQNYGLYDDGIVGPSTMATLLEVSSNPGAIVSPSSVGRNC